MAKEKKDKKEEKKEEPDKAEEKARKKSLDLLGSKSYMGYVAAALSSQTHYANFSGELYALAIAGVPDKGTWDTLFCGEQGILTGNYGAKDGLLKNALGMFLGDFNNLTVGDITKLTGVKLDLASKYENKPLTTLDDKERSLLLGFYAEYIVGERVAKSVIPGNLEKIVGSVKEVFGKKEEDKKTD
jgi:hypothetical protein